jgi:hypothetical protein
LNLIVYAAHAIGDTASDGGVGQIVVRTGTGSEVWLEVEDDGSGSGTGRAAFAWFFAWFFWG